MKKLLISLITVVFIISACNRANEGNSATEAGAEINPDNVVLIDLDVKGMTCTGCENTVKSGVSELEGVMEVEASHTNAKTFVKADTSLISLEKISEKIRSAGYSVESSSIRKGEMPMHESEDNNP